MFAPYLLLDKARPLLIWRSMNEQGAILKVPGDHRRSYDRAVEEELPYRMTLIVASKGVQRMK